MYGYRPDRNERGAGVLSDSDRRLTDLACGLIEDAFYRGNLLGMPKEQAASVAFTVNVMAKIFESNATGGVLKGFNREKLTHFADAVHAYEQETLFPAIEESAKGNTPRENWLEASQKKIDATRTRADALRPQDAWEGYFKSQIDSLEQATQLLESDAFEFNGVLGSNSLRPTLEFFREHWQDVRDSFDERTTNVHAASLSEVATPNIKSYRVYNSSKEESLFDAMLWLKNVSRSAKPGRSSPSICG